MIQNKAFIRIAGIFAFSWMFLWGQEGSDSSQQIKIIANYKERTKEQILAIGNVEIYYKNIKLFADRVELNPETKDVYAEGNVVIQGPDEVLSAEKIHFNLESSSGEMHEVFGMIQPTIFYEAESVKKKDENLYGFEKARITSCTQPVPRWNFSCSKANFKKDAYVEMWNSVFHIKKIPVFYMPYMRYPIGRDRATGFLMPQVGYSGQKGMSYSQSFFWAIQRNMDATVNMDYYSARGLGAGLEYRYLFSEAMGGQIQFFFFDFKNNPKFEDPENAYILRFKHNQPLPFDFALVADVDYQSSFNFLREFDNNFKRAVISNRSSQVYLSRSWSYFNLNMRASRFETYFKKIDNSIIRNSLPQIGLSSSKIKLFSPLYFSFSASFDRWEYGWESAYKNDKQTRSESLEFHPAFTVPFTTIPWLTLNTSFSGNFFYYFQSYAPNTRRAVGEPVFSHNYSLNMEMLGPIFNKVYYGSGGEAKLKHIVEPSVVYRYDSPVTSKDQIITASGYFFRFHQLSYGLTNRLLVKKDNMPREVFTVGLNQVFYIVPEESPLQRFRVDGKIPEFSDINGYVRFYPSSKYSLDFSAGFNPYYKTFSSLRLGANLGTPEDPLFLRVNWYKSINPYAVDVFWNRHQISFFSGVKIPRLSLEAQAEVDFNIEERELLYLASALVYHYQCLDFKADMRVFYFREKPEVQFRISFGLGNIGKTTDFLGGMGW